MPSKRSARDQLLMYVIGIVLAILAVGFTAAWFYLQHRQRLDGEIAYLTIPQVAISHGGHSIRASFAVRTSATDAEWAAASKPALEQVMMKGLMDADPQRALAPGGLASLEKTLLAESRAALQTDRLQEVLITDFLVSEGDL